MCALYKCVVDLNHGGKNVVIVSAHMHTVSDLTPTLPIFPSKYDVVPCNFDNCKDSCI